MSRQIRNTTPNDYLDPKWDKWFIAVWFGVLVFCLAFWAAFIYIVLHFVMKWW
jgi:phage shock protein PspC (stress-responsive transcriptional regulator)